MKQRLSAAFFLIITVPAILVLNFLTARQAFPQVFFRSVYRGSYLYENGGHFFTYMGIQAPLQDTNTERIDPSLPYELQCTKIYYQERDDPLDGLLWADFTLTNYSQRYIRTDYRFFSVDQKIGGEWYNCFTAISSQTMQSVGTVAPGETIQSTVSLAFRYYVNNDTEPRYQNFPSGTYRVVVKIGLERVALEFTL